MSIFVYVFTFSWSSKLAGEFDKCTKYYMRLSSYDVCRRNKMFTYKISIVLFLSVAPRDKKGKHKIFSFYENDLWQPPNCVIKISENSNTLYTEMFWHFLDGIFSSFFCFFYFLKRVKVNICVFQPNSFYAFSPGLSDFIVLK